MIYICLDCGSRRLVVPSTRPGIIYRVCPICRIQAAFKYDEGYWSN